MLYSQYDDGIRTGTLWKALRLAHLEDSRKTFRIEDFLGLVSVYWYPDRLGCKAILHESPCEDGLVVSF